MFSFLHTFSLLSNSPSKTPRIKETSEDWRAAPFLAFFNWGEEFGQNKTAHLLETEKRGTYPPGDCKCRERCWQLSIHRSHFPRRAPGKLQTEGPFKPCLSTELPFAEPDRKRRLNDTLTICRLPRWLYKPGWLH